MFVWRHASSYVNGMDIKFTFSQCSRQQEAGPVPLLSHPWVQLSDTHTVCQLYCFAQIRSMIWLPTCCTWWGMGPTLLFSCPWVQLSCLPQVEGGGHSHRAVPSRDLQGSGQVPLWCSYIMHFLFIIQVTKVHKKSVIFQSFQF